MAVETSLSEQRQHRRLDLRLPLEYSYPSGNATTTHRTVTHNVSTGGVYFETAAEELHIGDELAIHLSVPPNDSRFPPHTTVSTIGKIIRTACIKEMPDEQGISLTRYGIAAQFQSPLKFTL